MDTLAFDINQKRKEMLKDAADVVRDLRFIQANAITCLNLKGKAYLEAREYMLKLAKLQSWLEKELIND